MEAWAYLSRLGLHKGHVRLWLVLSALWLCIISFIGYDQYSERKEFCSEVSYIGGSRTFALVGRTLDDPRRQKIMTECTEEMHVKVITTDLLALALLPSILIPATIFMAIWCFEWV